MFKKLLASVLCITMLSAPAVFAESTSETGNDSAVQIIINGEKLVPKDVNGQVVSPFILEGTTYLPIRAVSEALGQKVNWDGEKRIIYIGESVASETEASDVIQIVINSRLLTPTDVNGKIVNPILADGTTYVPVRAITEALEKNVRWDGNERIVYIDEAFSIDFSTLIPFAEKTLMTVNSHPVSGSLFNLFHTSFTTNEYLKEWSENFSSEGNLQSLTFNSIPVAQVLTEEIAGSFVPVFALYDYAEKSGYTKEEEFQTAFKELLPYVKEELLMQYDIAAASEAKVSTSEELSAFTEVIATYILISQKIQLDASLKSFDFSEFEKLFRENYVTAKHILVTDEALASEIISKIEKGEDFDSLMKEHNTDPGATAEGYTFTYGEMVEPFEKAAFALKENEFTKAPVKTDYGYHIIMRLPLSEKVLADAKSYLQGQQALTDAQNEINSIIEKADVKYTSDYENYIKTIK